MLDSLSFPALLAVFILAAGAIWFAGVKLANTADVLATRLHWGQALGGLILLAVATNLPEIAITASAAWRHQIDVATGNILGGIAIQTVVLVALDVWGVKRPDPLTYRAASLGLVLEGVLVVAVLVVAIMATQLPSSLLGARLAPGDVLIAILWIAGIVLVGKARDGLPWHDPAGDAPDTQAERKQNQADDDKPARREQASMARTAAVFAVAAVVTLVAGVALEASGTALAGHIHMTGVLFGATFLAAATALPELSTGLTAVREENYKLAISDIFGGNAFLPVLFLGATLISGQAVLTQAHKTDIYLAALGILLTCAYLYGLIFRPRRRVLRMGVDSLVVLVLYVVGTGGLVAITLAESGS